MSALSAPAGHLPLEGKATIRESPLLKRRRATLVNPSAPSFRHPERSRGIFLALRLASHMSLQGNDALLLLFPTSNIHRSSVCKKDFSTSLEMTIREYRYPHHLRASPYLYSAALPYFYAPHHHFAFLISNFSFKRGFQTESRGAPPHGLTLNPIQKRPVFRRGVFYHNQIPISPLHMLPSHPVHRKQERCCLSPLLPSPDRHGRGCDRPRGSHS